MAIAISVNSYAVNGVAKTAASKIFVVSEMIVDGLAAGTSNGFATAGTRVTVREKNGYNTYDCVETVAQMLAKMIA